MLLAEGMLKQHIVDDETQSVDLDALHAELLESALLLNDFHRWLMIYPFDIIKSRVQTAPLSAPPLCSCWPSYYAPRPLRRGFRPTPSPSCCLPAALC